MKRWPARRGGGFHGMMRISGDWPPAACVQRQRRPAATVGHAGGRFAAVLAGSVGTIALAQVLYMSRHRVPELDGFESADLLVMSIRHVSTPARAIPAARAVMRLQFCVPSLPAKSLIAGRALDDIRDAMMPAPATSGPARPTPGDSLGGRGAAPEQGIRWRRPDGTAELSA